jgi:mRNA interferase MazF
MKDKIVLVPFPFDDFNSTKVRPAISLTNPYGKHRHVILAFITSRVDHANEPFDIKLLTTNKDFSQTGLKTNSAIRLHRMVTVPKRLIKRELGSVSLEYKIQINDRLRALFEI